MKKVGEKQFRRYVWFALIGLVLVTGLLSTQLSKLDFDYDFEKFFPIDDEETDFFFEHRDRFESDNDFLLVSIENKKGIFNKEFLEEVEEFRKELNEVKNVQFVSGITNMEERIMYSTGLSVSKPYIDFDDFDSKRDSAKIYAKTELLQSFVSDNGKSLCLYLRHDDFLSKDKSDKVIDGIDKLKSKYKFDNLRVAGRAIGQKYYIDKMSFEMMLFVGLSAFLVILFLGLAFRSGWGIIVPQIVIMSGMVWLLGLMGFFEEPINIILTILPSIMFVVSMSDVIHLVSRYLDALREEDDVFSAIKIAVREVGLATLLTSVTTAIGFLSLYFVQVQPIQVFGVVMAVGVIIAFLLTFLTLPAFFYVFPGPKYVRKNKKDHFWKKHLHRWFGLVIKRRKRVLLISSLGVGACIFLMFQIKTNNFLMDDLRESEPLKQDFNYLDAHFGGVRPFELSVFVQDTSKNVWDLEILNQLDSVERYLAETMDVKVRTSLASSVKIINRSIHGGNAEHYTIPSSKRKLRKAKKPLKIAGEGKFIHGFVDTTEMITRISGSMADLGNVEVNRRNKKLRSFLDGLEKEGLIKYQITGTAHLFDKNMSYLSVSLVKGLSISILIVALIIGLIYKSIRILIISIVPNVLPLLVMAGFMGMIGIELKTSTSIIFTIAFGIAVDDTIHFLGKFKYELMKGKSRLYALKRSYMTTGKAMILTTLILCSGFFLLVFSGFLGTFYMGLMLCLTLFVALIADLTLLPVLLLLFYHPKPKPVRGND